jgi:hypothetical protein
MSPRPPRNYRRPYNPQDPRVKGRDLWFMESLQRQQRQQQQPESQPSVGKPTKSTKKKSTKKKSAKSRRLANKKKLLTTQVAKKKKKLKKKPTKQVAKKRSASQATPPARLSTPALILSPGMRAYFGYEKVAPALTEIVADKDKGPYPSLNSAAEAMRVLLRDQELRQMSDSARKRWIKKHHPEWFVRA